MGFVVVVSDFAEDQVVNIQELRFADADLPRLQAALAGWIGEAGGCGYYHPGNLPHWIYEILRGRRPVGESVRLWEDESGIGGVAITGLFGSAFHVFTRPAWRGTDLELGLLRATVEMTLRQLDEDRAADRTVTTDVFGCDEIRKGQLARLGFGQFRLWDHIVERNLAAPIPEPELPAGFLIRSARFDDYGQLTLVRNSAFASDWTPEQYRDQVMAKPGYMLEHELVVAAPDGQIASLTVIRLDPLNRIGLFEPVATRREFQRRGLGQALLLYGLSELRRLGMGTATVGYDASNQAAGALYRRVGFTHIYETFGYMRQQ